MRKEKPKIHRMSEEEKKEMYECLKLCWRYDYGKPKETKQRAEYYNRDLTPWLTVIGYVFTIATLGSVVKWSLGGNL